MTWFCANSGLLNVILKKDASLAHDRYLEKHRQCLIGKLQDSVEQKAWRNRP